MLEHKIIITFQEYENTEEDFNLFKDRFAEYLKNNADKLKDRDDYVEDYLRNEFFPEDELLYNVDDDREVLGDATIDYIFSNIRDYQYESTYNLFRETFRRFLTKQRQLLCPAPTQSNE